jgi:glutathione S-transferase
MIEIIQFPWSPYCLVIRRILEYAGVPFKIVDIPPNDRSLVWRLTRQRYYAVPIITDGKTVVFETDENSQVIAKYLDTQLTLGLFPRAWDGVQMLLWRYFENDIEGAGFKLNDIYYREFVPVSEQLAYLRHKDRKFGRGCLEVWRKQQKPMLAELAQRLMPCEEMLLNKPFLLGDGPLFVDFDLYGMLANFLYSGHYKIPALCRRLREWYPRMERLARAG